MAMLVPFLPYDPAETVQSYAGRLAMFHTGQRAARLLEDCGVKLARFAAGHSEEVAQFAEAVGEDPAGLEAGTIRTLSRYNRFRGEDCSRTVLSPRVRQFCPHCLREDGPVVEWRHRLEWCFWPVATCARHRSILIEVFGEGVADIRDAVECADGLDVAEMASSGAEGGRCLAWLGDRLRAARDPSWLDGQTIEQVLNASEMLGMVLDHGQDVRPARLTRLERCDALETGFRIYEQGSEAVYAALGHIRHKASATAVQAGPLAMYGVLYDWLDRRSQLIDPGAIRHILREHILDHDAYMRGDRLLGEVMTEQRLHSVKSLANTLNVDRRRMSRLLQKLGLVPVGATDGESGRLVFRVHEVEQLVSDYETAIPLAEVPQYIGATHNHALALYRAGILPAVIPAEAPGAVRGVLVARRVLDELLDRIGALPPLDPDRSYEALPVGKACQRYGRPADVLIRDVLAGKIAAFRTLGEPRLHAVRVLMSDMVASRQAKVVHS